MFELELFLNRLYLELLVYLLVLVLLYYRRVCNIELLILRCLGLEFIDVIMGIFFFRIVSKMIIKFKSVSNMMFKGEKCFMFGKFDFLLYC